MPTIAMKYTGRLPKVAIDNTAGASNGITEQGLQSTADKDAVLTVSQAVHDAYVGAAGGYCWTDASS